MSMSEPVALALLVGVVLLLKSEAAANDHRPAFEVFCKLIRLTESNITRPHTANLPTNLENDLIKLNMTTADDTWYDLFSGKDEDTWDKVKDKEPFKEWATKDKDLEKKYGKWNAAKKELLEDAAKGGASEFQRPLASLQRLVAHTRIRRLAARYHIIHKERDAQEQDLEDLAIQIEKKFRKARTASDAKNVVDADSFGQNRGSSDYPCGYSSGETSAAGKSLANDLVCICTATSSSGHANQLCEGTLTTQVSNVPWGGTATNALTAYGHLREKCPKIGVNITPTAHTLQKLLANFWALFGKSSASGAAQPSAYAIGGTGSGGVSANACGGGSAAAVCVTYHVNFRPTTGDPKGIPWLTELESALEKLEELKAEEQKVHALKARAESLRDAAWADYDESIQQPMAGSANEVASTTAAKAEKPTTAVPGAEGKAEERSPANLPRLILPWVFLI